MFPAAVFHELGSDEAGPRSPFITHDMDIKLSGPKTRDDQHLAQRRHRLLRTRDMRTAAEHIN